MVEYLIELSKQGYEISTRYEAITDSYFIIVGKRKGVSLYQKSIRISFENILRCRKDMLDFMIINYIRQAVYLIDTELMKF